jgi:hypothetical protein
LTKLVDSDMIHTMPIDTYEIQLRKGKAKKIKADSVKEERYKISFYIHH